VIAQLSLVVASAGVLLAQQLPPSSLVFNGQRVTVIAAQPTTDGVAPAGPAKICLAPSGMCFTPDLQFGFSPEATVVQLGPNQQALLFSAIASASGSGSTKLLALLDIRNGQLNTLTDVKISEQGEYKIWQEPSISKTALLVTADYVWGAAEGHLSAHRFKISTYDLGSVAGGDSRFQVYHLRDEYMTSQKYPSFDDVDRIAVLEQEKQEVLARLRRQK
jgi:hypothetical protein